MIEEVVERVGKLADMVNYDKWQLAEVVHDVYLEFPHHTQNLTSALCQRCKLSSTQLYNLKNAWTMRVSQISYQGNEIDLSVSHFSKVYALNEIYHMGLDNCVEYLNMAVTEGLSVQKLAQEIEGNHDMNTDEKEKKIFTRWLKTMRKCWQFAMFNALPKDVREAYYKLMQALEEAAK